MNELKPQCTLCHLGLQPDLKSNCLPARWPKSKGHPKILLVVENPSREDDAYGQPLTEQAFNRSRTGAQIAWQVIDTLGIPRDAVDVTSLTRCQMRTKGGKITDDNVHACLPYLWEELRAKKPDMVVAMGLSVSKYLTGHKKLQTARGSYGRIQLPKKLAKLADVPDDLFDVKITSTVAPGALWAQEVQATGNGRSLFTEDMTQVWQRLNGLERDSRCDYKWLETYEEIDNYFTEVEALYAAGKIPGVVVDVETNYHLDPFKKTARLVAIGFSHTPWFARAVKIHHKQEKNFSVFGQAVWEAFQRRLQRFFDLVPCGGWNFKFDIRWLRRHAGASVRKVYFDGHIAHNAIFSESKASHGLKEVSLDLLGLPIPEAEMNAAIAVLARQGYDKADQHMGNIDETVLLSYLGGDVDKSVQNYFYMNPMLDNDHCYFPVEFQYKYPGMSHRRIYEELMLPSVLAFSEIEDNGVAVNQPLLRWFTEMYPKRLAENLTPILESPWAKNLWKKMFDKLFFEQYEKEKARVEKHNAKELEKARADEARRFHAEDLDEDDLPYAPKYVAMRSNDEIAADVKMKEPRTMVSYYLNLSKLLYEEAGFMTAALQLKLPRKTRVAAGGYIEAYYPTGTNERAKLLEWAQKNGSAEQVKLISDIEKYKKDEKLYSAYVKSMTVFTEADGFMRSTYNLTGARTGRCSTTEPNMHSMPTKDFHDPLAITKLFVSRWVKEGGLIVQFDYSQLEMRIIAAIANDENLMNLFVSGLDTHKQMASNIFKVPFEQVTGDQRKKGKTISFGVLYGMGADSMAARTGLTKDEATEKINNFFDGFPMVKRWIDQQVADMKSRIVIREGTGRHEPNPRWQAAKERGMPLKFLKTIPEKILVDFEWELYGYITTVFGRKRVLKDGGHWEHGYASKAERQAYNTPIQSAASDMALAATIRIHNRFKAEGMQSRVFGFIHDSIKVDVFPPEYLRVLAIMKEEMEDVPKRIYEWLKVPIATSLEVGIGWGNHVEVKNYDLTERTFEFEGEATNIRFIERALVQQHEVIVIERHEGEKDYKLKIRLEPKAEQRRAA